jgi:transcription-repair coupling factor (superfamily II helicase)
MKKTKPCYTDHQIFERYHKFNIKKQLKKQNITLKELTTLSVGDYVTHIDHGIGRFEVCKKYRSRTKHRKL